MHEIYLRSVCDAGACWETQGCAVTFSKCISTGGRAGVTAPRHQSWGDGQERLSLFVFFSFPHPLDLPLCYHHVANSISFFASHN